MNDGGPRLLGARAPRAWVLNLDAERELENGRAVAGSRPLRAVMARQQRRLLGNLVAPGDVVLSGEPGPADRRARGLPGHVWCPTPSALARLAAAGARPVATAPTDVVRAVNARPFAAAVRAPLVDGSFAKRIALDLEAVLEALARPAPDGWLVRRTFGAAGRGRRRLAAGRPTAEQTDWILAGLRRGPLSIEPWVWVTREYTRSAWLHPDGRLQIGPPCLQATTDQGAWTETQRAARAEAAHDDARLEQAVVAAGAALARAGYFGPFGIDAFRHRCPGGRGEVLNPMSEINARFTMDWATGMG